MQKKSSQKVSNVIKKSKIRKKITLSDLNDELVIQYLLKNPDFFIRQSALIDDIAVSHPIREEISFSEWQLVRHRKKIHQLKSETHLLLEHADNNEQLFESFTMLQNELLRSTDVNDLLIRLNKWAKSIGLSGVYLHLFDDKWQLNAPSRYCYLALSIQKFEFIRVRYLQYDYHYLGKLNITELNILVKEKGYVGSAALSLLGEFGDLGVLVFTSRYSDHYQTGQGTLLLDKIRQFITLLIPRWISRTESK